jgi:hypothetical protein
MFVTRFRIVALALLGIASPLAAFKNAHPAGFPRNLAIIQDIRGQASLITLVEMQSELESILHIPDLEIEWRALDEATYNEVFDRLVVVRLQGNCTMAGAGAPDLKTRTLGFAHISDGDILPFADIDCNRIRDVVESAVSGEGPMNKEMLLGRALGRVLAHELYHILTRSTTHAYTGVAKPLLTPQDLVRPRLVMDESSLEAIEQAITPMPVEPTSQIVDTN